MNIKENDNLPNSEVFILEDGEPVKKNIENLFKNKKVVIFGLPGAYTSVCSAKHLPGYVNMFEKYKEKGIDQIICISVNDPFVMNAWGKDLGLKSITLIPDGEGVLTSQIGMLVDKPGTKFGKRSWRYSAFVADGIVKKMFIEDGINNISDENVGDPYEESKPEKILDLLLNFILDLIHCIHLILCNLT